MIYLRKSNCVYFLLPAMAIGLDDGYWFVELAFLDYAVGFGVKK